MQVGVMPLGIFLYCSCSVRLQVRAVPMGPSDVAEYGSGASGLEAEDLPSNQLLELGWVGHRNRP